MKEVRFEIIPADLAASFKDFMLPPAAEHTEFDKLTFFAAIVDDMIVAILVCDAKRVAPEFLSICVSPDFEGQGIATGLLNFAITEVLSRYGDEVNIPNNFSARVVGPVGSCDKICHILESIGFKQTENSEFYETRVSSLDSNHILQSDAAKERAADPKYRALKDCTSGLINTFGNQIIEEGLSEGLNLNDLDKDISYFVVENEKVKSGILFYEESEGVIQNAFVYKVNEDILTNMETVVAFSASASAVLEKYPCGKRLSFLAEDEGVARLIKKVFPNAKVTGIAKGYELKFEDVLSSGTERFTDDIAFTHISNENMVCATCRHCMENVMECKVYLQKPDRVLDGADCPDFENA
ncbi:MAG: GNAT family N-acetyltransferase [Lachnospiraceae bacterium]|nr:GNAT family N-acetyltransferase [Lachnospiraceae bacterium]